MQFWLVYISASNFPIFNTFWYIISSNISLFMHTFWRTALQNSAECWIFNNGCVSVILFWKVWMWLYMCTEFNFFTIPAVTWISVSLCVDPGHHLLLNILPSFFYRLLSLDIPSFPLYYHFSFSLLSFLPLFLFLHSLLRPKPFLGSSLPFFHNSPP